MSRRRNNWCLHMGYATWLNLAHTQLRISLITELVAGVATRLADVCNNSGSAQDFNSEEGVIVYVRVNALANDLVHIEIFWFK